MLEKMKNIYELQKKANEIKNKLEAVKVEQMEGGNTVKINGSLKVESLDLNPDFLVPENKEKLQSLLCNLLNNAISEAQKRSAVESAELFKGLI